MPATASAPYFSIQTSDLCVVAVYTAPALTLGFDEPTWGRHGGPLTASTMMGSSATATNVDVERWTLAGTTLTKTSTTVPVMGVSSTTDFFDSQLLDLLPTESVIAWTGAAPTDGQIVFLNDTAVVGSPANTTGVFSYAKVGPSTGGVTRLVYTGTSTVAATMPGKNGVYAADFHTDGSSAGSPVAVSQWGEASGPVASDSAGNVIAIATKFSDGTQEMRGFAATTIAPLAGPSNGDVLLDTNGFGSSLAAIAPSGTNPGLAVLQPEIGMGTNQDVVLVKYTSNGSKLTPSPMTTLLKLTTADTGFSLMTDDQDRIWVGAATASGMGTTFLVLARP